jgi:hypothetical protein
MEGDGLRPHATPPVSLNFIPLLQWEDELNPNIGGGRPKIDRNPGLAAVPLETSKNLGLDILCTPGIICKLSYDRTNLADLFDHLIPEKRHNAAESSHRGTLWQYTFEVFRPS